MAKKPRCRFCERMKDNYRMAAVLEPKGVKKFFAVSILETTINEYGRRIDRDDNAISPGHATGYKIYYCPMCGKPIKTYAEIKTEVNRNAKKTEH